MLNKINFFLSNKGKKQLVSNLLSLSLLQVFSYVLPLLTIPYLVRVLGTEKFGLIMFAQAFMVYFSIFVDFGFNLSATREVSVHRDDKSKIKEIFSSVILIKGILLFFSFIIMVIIINFFEMFSLNKKLYMSSFLLVIGQALFPIWYFQGVERMKYITIINIFIKVLFTLMIFLIIQNEKDYIYVPIINGLGYILGGIISLFFIKRTFKQEFKIYPYNTLKKYFLDSFDFFLSRLSVSLYTASNVFFLGLFTNNLIVGYYSIAEKLYNALQQLYSPIVQALYPFFAKEQNVKFFKKVFYGISLINVLGIILLFILSQEIFDILFSSKVSQDSLHVFSILLIAAIFVIPSITLGYPFLGALGFNRQANLSVIIGSVIHILGLVALVFFKELTIYSVAIMVLITELTVLSIRIYFVNKNKLWNSPKRTG